MVEEGAEAEAAAAEKAVAAPPPALPFRLPPEANAASLRQAHRPDSHRARVLRALATGAARVHPERPAATAAAGAVAALRPGNSTQPAAIRFQEQA